MNLHISNAIQGMTMITEDCNHDILETCEHCYETLSKEELFECCLVAYGIIDEASIDLDQRDEELAEMKKTLTSTRAARTRAENKVAKLEKLIPGGAKSIPKQVAKTKSGRRRCCTCSQSVKWDYNSRCDFCKQKDKIKSLDKKLFKAQDAQRKAERTKKTELTKKAKEITSLKNKVKKLEKEVEDLKQQVPEAANFVVGSDEFDHLET